MKSSLREKKRIKEGARHLPPVRRWFLLSAIALSCYETLLSFLYLLCQRKQFSWHFSEEINTSHVASQILWNALYATLSCKARSPLPHLQVGYYTKENLPSALARTPPFSKEGMLKDTSLEQAYAPPQAKLSWSMPARLVLSCLPNRDQPPWHDDKIGSPALLRPEEF